MAGNLGQAFSQGKSICWDLPRDLLLALCFPGPHPFRGPFPSGCCGSQSVPCSNDVVIMSAAPTERGAPQTLLLTLRMPLSVLSNKRPGERLGSPIFLFEARILALRCPTDGGYSQPSLPVVAEGGSHSGGAGGVKPLFTGAGVLDTCPLPAGAVLLSVQMAVARASPP